MDNKVKTTNPKRYCVRPNAGILSPHSVCNVTGERPYDPSKDSFTCIVNQICLIGFMKYAFFVVWNVLICFVSVPFIVTMQAQKEAPPDMQCRDKFLVQSVVAPTAATNKDINQEMFNKEDGKVVDEFRLRVVYIPANPPSPVPEGDEEGTSPGTSSAEDEIQRASLSEAVGRSLNQSMGNSSSKEWSAVTKLNEEKDSVIKQNQKLLGELELVRRQMKQGRRGGASFSVLLFGLLLGLSVGYFVWK